MKRCHYYLDGRTIKVGFLLQFRVGFINIVRTIAGVATLGPILEIVLFIRGHVFGPFVSLRFWEGQALVQGSECGYQGNADNYSPHWCHTSSQYTLGGSKM